MRLGRSYFPNLRKVIPNQRKLITYFAAFVASVATIGLLLASIGKNPLTGYQVLVESTFGSPGSISLLLLDFTPLFMMTMAFVVPLRAGKYNIGNEGQFLLGATGAVFISFMLPTLPGFLGVPLLLLFSIIFGALWAAVPALLLLWFKVNEIVSTISMNFIAFSLVLYIGTGPWHDPLVGYPQTKPIPAGYLLPNLIDFPRVGLGFVVAVLVPIAVFYFISKTTWGYELRAVGSNPRASLINGIRTDKVVLLSMIVGGGLAGLAGGIQVAGLLQSLQYGMQANYGLLSYVPALISPSSLAGLAVVSIFISAIDNGTSAMQGILGVPSELGLIIESLLLLFILLANGVGGKRR